MENTEELKDVVNYDNVGTRKTRRRTLTRPRAPI